MAPPGIAQHVDNRPEDSSDSRPTAVQVLIASPSIQVRVSGSAVVSLMLSIVLLIAYLRDR